MGDRGEASGSGAGRRRRRLSRGGTSQLVRRLFCMQEPGVVEEDQTSQVPQGDHHTSHDAQLHEDVELTTDDARTTDRASHTSDEDVPPYADDFYEDLQPIPGLCIHFSLHSCYNFF